MSDVSADRRLELIRMVREEENRNYMAVKRRSALLYGAPYSPSGENQAASVPRTSLKMRIVLAVILFLAFLILDQSSTGILNIDGDTVFGYINGQTNVFDFIEKFTYTVKD